MNAISPANMLAPPSKTTRSSVQLHRRLFATILLGTSVPVTALEILHHLQAAPDGPWQLGLRLLVASAIAFATAIALSQRIARRWAKLDAPIRETPERQALSDSAAWADIADDSPDKSPQTQIGGRFHQLLDTLQQMSHGAKQLGHSTEKLSQDSEPYMTQINETSAAVEEIVESIQQVAKNTFVSSKVAAEARHNATVGSQAVSNTIKGMQRIRNQVQSNSKRIKQLGESTQEIGEIVQLISDVADRTSLLALNASIQAAMAGEAGQGFGVVAEEVELLSKRCNEATKQMARLVKNVQLETAEAVGGMEESIAEVVEGSKLASQAGEALADVDTVSHRLAELIESISTATKQQVRGGLLASRSMNEISTVMHSNATGTKRTAQSACQLAALAEELCSAVQNFDRLDVALDLPKVTANTHENGGLAVTGSATS